MPQSIEPPKSTSNQSIDALTFVAFAFVMYLVVAVVYSLGIPESEHRIGCALRGITEGLVVDPRACP